MLNKVIIEFASAEAANHFATWLCESGEQSYWDWMEYREREDDGDITAVSFDYHTANRGEFGTYIMTTLGRLDSDE